MAKRELDTIMNHRFGKFLGDRSSTGPALSNDKGTAIVAQDDWVE
jgi:hypothetical protein